MRASLEVEVVSGRAVTRSRGHAVTRSCDGSEDGLGSFVVRRALGLLRSSFIERG